MSNSVRPHRRQPTRLPRPWDSPGKNTGVGCRFLLQCMKVKSESEVARSCPTLSDPMDCSPPGFSVHGIFQARVLQWVVIAFSGIPKQRDGQKISKTQCLSDKCYGKNKSGDEKVTFGWRLKSGEGLNHVDISERNIPGGGKVKCRVLKWDLQELLTYILTGVTVWLGKWVRGKGRGWGSRGTEWARWGSWEPLGSFKQTSDNSKLCLMGSLLLLCREWTE